MEPIVVTLHRGKETKSTHRFEASEKADVPVETVYIKKSAFTGARVPEAVRLTVEVVEKAEG